MLDVVGTVWRLPCRNTSMYPHVRQCRHVGRVPVILRRPRENVEMARRAVRRQMFKVDWTTFSCLPARNIAGNPHTGTRSQVNDLPIVYRRPVEDEKPTILSNRGEVFDIVRSVERLPARWRAANLGAGNARYVDHLPVVCGRPPEHQQVVDRTPRRQVLDVKWTVGGLPTRGSPYHHGSGDRRHVDDTPVMRRCPIENEQMAGRIVRRQMLHDFRTVRRLPTRDTARDG